MGGLLSIRDRDIRETEVGARGAEDVDVGTAGGDGAFDIFQAETADRNSVGWSAGRGTVLVVLLDNDAVLGDVLEGDVGVCDVGHRAGRTVDGLDADT